jgi:hypothetical protein
LTVGYPVSFKVDQDMGTIESATIPWWRSLFGNPLMGKVTPTPKEALPTPVADDSQTVTQHGIAITISPTQGPSGTKVSVKIEGIVPNPSAPYATIVLLATNGIGKDAETIDTTKIKNGTYETTYVIPTMVMTSQPGGQNYSKEVTIEIGSGTITFSYQHPTLRDILIKAPFSVTAD